MGGVGSGRYPKKTAAQHIVTGTYRPSRHGPVVELPRPSVPISETAEAPAGLSEASRALRDRLLDQYDGWSAPELVLVDCALLALDRAAECRTAIAAAGLTTAKGRAHPLLIVLRAEERFAFDVLRRLLER
jgi:hypothetical protein